ncbi:MAG: T9SS type A sorting domain-containing protein, partial [Bacteroidales bacterium]|nr:T9SS type A sorting domain-containing protein [Bacteroidales bacterium]
EMQQQGFQVFPNPTDGQINLKWDETLSGKIVISDIRGNIVDTVPFANSKSLAIPTNGIAQGIYSITCLDKNGSILAIKKIIVR